LSEAPMTPQDFDYIRRLVLERSAVVLDAGKEYLVDCRLTPIVRRLNLNSISELVARLRSQPFNGMHVEVVEAMVTTETSFFRDLQPFEALRKSVIPELIRLRQNEKRLNIWCAATSSGQEPYSVAMLLKEHFPALAEWKLLLLASDLSGEMLSRAREGRYSQLEVNRGLPAALLIKYFEQQGLDWRISPALREMIKFESVNLAKPFPPMPPMDLVILRNVMIYFDVPTKKEILGKVAKLLKPGGYLLLGGAETTFNIDDSYKRIEQLRTGFYQLVG
jgi:chemotaxis protein methyltransferase CheR